MRDFDPSDEYRFLSAAGLSFAQILAMLTTAPAERFDAAARAGRIEPGLDADLVALDGDPEQDAVRYALRRGEILYASE
jgi:imidazolonepropionase-like amidohydrolase